MILALFQPDIAQNTGSLMRLAACLGVPLHIVEPCGFPFDDRRMKRVGMDYIDRVALTRHTSWDAFLDFYQQQIDARLILLSAHASLPYTQFTYTKNDILLVGRESAGLPDYVKVAAKESVTIPMQEGARSLNVTMAASMVLGEALRQVNGNTGR